MTYSHIKQSFIDEYEKKMSESSDRRSKAFLEDKLTYIKEAKEDSALGAAMKCLFQARERDHKKDLNIAQKAFNDTCTYVVKDGRDWVLAPSCLPVRHIGDDDLKIVRETEKAYLVFDPNDKCEEWIPKSGVHDDMVLSLWLCEKINGPAREEEFRQWRYKNKRETKENSITPN